LAEKRKAQGEVPNPKKQAVADALARVQAKKQANKAEIDSNLTPEDDS